MSTSAKLSSLTNMLKNGGKVLSKVATTAASVFLFQEFIGGFVWCTGPSMKPTIFPNDVIITDHISPRIGNISKGDVIIARSPRNLQVICKRVVGVSGEPVLYKGKIIKIPENHYWLEGDNKFDSTDSRDYGPVPANMIRRRCICKVWPYVDMKFQDAIQFRSVAASK